MSQIKFNCSHCGQRLECDSQLSSREIACPTCRGLTLVPDGEGKPTPVLQKSGMTFVPESWGKPGKAKSPPQPPRKPE